MSIPVGSLTKIADGVECIRLPYPGGLGHINSYLLDRSILIDAGLNTPKTREVWDHILTHELADWRPDCFILSHFHPDHVGLGQYLSDRFECPVTMTYTEWVTGRMLFLENSDQRQKQVFRFYVSHGVPDDIATQLADNRYRQMIDRYPGMMDPMPDNINGWRTRIASGHSPAQVVLEQTDRNICFIGDHVLPRISPNISVYPNIPADNPLQRYLNSLNDFREVPDEQLILPSHGNPFKQISHRIDEIRDHHETRNENIIELCHRPMTAYQITKQLFDRELSGWAWYFAIGETLAHINYLMADGRVIRHIMDDNGNGDDGDGNDATTVIRYQAASS